MPFLDGITAIQLAPRCTFNLTAVPLHTNSRLSILFFEKCPSRTRCGLVSPFSIALLTIDRHGHQHWYKYRQCDCCEWWKQRRQCHRRWCAQIGSTILHFVLRIPIVALIVVWGIFFAVFFFWFRKKVPPGGFTGASREKSILNLFKKIIPRPSATGSGCSLVVGGSGNCLSTDGYNVVMAACNGSLGQQWVFGQTDQTLRSSAFPNNCINIDGAPPILTLCWFLS